MLPTLAVTCLLALAAGRGADGGGWTPIAPPHAVQLAAGLGEPFDDPGASRRLGFPPQLRLVDDDSDQCALYKVSMAQELYFQYIQYKLSIPDMTEFTMCAWTKFYNHSNDHPIFSYAVPDLPKAVLVWVSNTARSSYFSISVAGHTLCRLNYPLRLNRWYHSCHSWNGRTGEWQVWVNAERVGRGFHNRLVGYKIPGGGIAVSGQEQRQFGGGFLEGPDSPRGSGGMLGEITMLHLYSAALYPGKAHRDHKHHHGHHHETNPANGIPPSATAQPQPPPTPPPQPFPPNPFLVGGQLRPEINIQAQLGRPHLGPNGVLRNPGALLPELQQPTALSLDLFQHKLFKRNELAGTTNGSEPLVAPGREEDALIRAASKEDLVKTTQLPETKHKKRSAPEGALEREMLGDAPEEKQPAKRGILLGLDGTSFVSGDYLGDAGGLLGGTHNVLGATDPQQKKEYEREPAEGEVLQILNVCSGCAPEPFKKVEVISWRLTPKKLYSGALFVPAKQECRRF
ncbi:uncharacterized protein LOC134541995 [Bacillus rossius redtenbacheri]|uniref:uncharacterized protein LOC134541995 n=1 Tax=Bacillus rossius redtenbacheri TaxID=93214 RepID=UPI002FDCD111